MDTRKRSKVSYGGFTLVELLVVIAIIALLLAILMPALNKVRRSAESMICKTHLKEISRCLSLYAYDNDQRMVTSSVYQHRWYHNLWSYYVKAGKDKYLGGAALDSEYTVQAFYCPVEWKKYQKMRKAQIASGKTVAETAADSPSNMYWMNSFFGCQYNDNGTVDQPADDTVSIKTHAHLFFSRLDKIKQPATLPLFWEGNGDTTPAANVNGWNGYPHPSMYQSGWDGVTTAPRGGGKSSSSGPSVNHMKGINYLFADMHVDNQGLWPYNQTASPMTGTSMSFTRASTNPDDYLTFFHPLRRLYQNGTSGTKTVGDGFPPAGIKVVP